MISKLKHWKKKILNDAIYALLLFPIFLPSAPMSLTQQPGSRSGRALKGHEREQKKNNRTKLKYFTK